MGKEGKGDMIVCSGTLVATLVAKTDVQTRSNMEQENTWKGTKSTLYRARGAIFACRVFSNRHPDL